MYYVKVFYFILVPLCLVHISATSAYVMLFITRESPPSKVQHHLTRKVKAIHIMCVIDQLQFIRQKLFIVISILFGPSKFHTQISVQQSPLYHLRKGLTQLLYRKYTELFVELYTCILSLPFAPSFVINIV